MTLDDFKKAVRKYLSEDQPKAALEFMATAIREGHSVQNSIVLQLGRCNRLRRERDNGIISQDEADTGSNKINSAINNMLSDVTAADLRPDQSEALPLPQGKSAEENKGLARAIALKVKIVNALQEKLALEDDPIRLVRYEEQLQQAEEQLSILKEKLAR